MWKSRSNPISTLVLPSPGLCWGEIENPNPPSLPASPASAPGHLEKVPGCGKKLQRESSNSRWPIAGRSLIIEIYPLVIPFLTGGFSGKNIQTLTLKFPLPRMKIRRVGGWFSDHWGLQCQVYISSRGFSCNCGGHGPFDFFKGWKKYGLNDLWTLRATWQEDAKNIKKDNSTWDPNMVETWSSQFRTKHITKLGCPVGVSLNKECPKIQSLVIIFPIRHD